MDLCGFLRSSHLRRIFRHIHHSNPEFLVLRSWVPGLWVPQQAYALMMSGMAAEIVLIDRDSRRAKGTLMIYAMRKGFPIQLELRSTSLREVRNARPKRLTMSKATRPIPAGHEGLIAHLVCDPRAAAIACQGSDGRGHPGGHEGSVRFAGTRSKDTPGMTATLRAVRAARSSIGDFARRQNHSRGSWRGVLRSPGVVRVSRSC